MTAARRREGSKPPSFTYTALILRYNKVHIVLTVASSSFKVQHQKINTSRNEVE